ncbi:MAG: hypothetical protein RMK45_07430, partial [Armatimonadota bacterium]|nr:hypothetical protein [Armatimonadota bacterium]
MRQWLLTGALACVLAGTAQQLPSRDDPVYDWAARAKPTPATLLHLPRDRDELLYLFRRSQAAVATLALWKLDDAAVLPPSEVWLVAEVSRFGYPKDSAWRTATGEYRIAGAWAVSPHALLEVVWSDARRRANPSAFDTVPYAKLTLRTGEWQWHAGYSTLRWAGGYSGALLVNDAMPPVPHLSVRFPLRLPLVGTWHVEQFLCQFEQDGATTWWGARRFERELNARWSVSLAEAFKALELPAGVLSQLVPYYLYQKWFSEAPRASGWFNYLAEIGAVYKLDAQNRAYLFWLLDDFRAPTAFGGAPITPRKVATLIGVRLHPTPHTRLRMELVRSDGTPTGGVYDASGHAPRYAYFYKDLPMGHPIG